MSRTDVTFAVDGTELAAWHYAADSDGPRPCVVMAHGFCGTRDAGLVGFGERFAAAGIDALCFDYRGFGASAGEPRQLVDLAGQRADYRAAIAAARRLPDVDRVAIWGTSLSGAHVLALAAERRDLAAAIAMTPIADGLKTILRMRGVRMRPALRIAGAAVRDAVGARRGRPPVLLPAVGPPGSASLLTTPDAAPGYAAAARNAPLWRNAFAARTVLAMPAYRPGRRGARISCPLLVQIAAADRNAPPELARAAARRAGAVVRTYEGAGHFDVYDVGSAFEAVVSDQIEFLATA